MEQAKVLSRTSVGKLNSNGMNHLSVLGGDPTLFKIQDGIPIPRGGKPSSKITADALNKMSYILNNLKPGQSFVFGNVSIGTVRKFIRNEFPELKIKIKLVDKQKGWYRMWLMP